MAAAPLRAAARLAAARLNRVRGRADRPASERARALHASLAVADLHDDLLLWGRDPLRRGSSGHSDVPRLLEGRVALQVFSAVTRMPWGVSARPGRPRGDLVALLAAAAGWPRDARRSPLARALLQAERLHAAAARSGGALEVVTSRAQLAAALAARGAGGDAGRKLLAVLSAEGLHALEGRPEHVDTLFAAGYRCAGLAHFFDNEVAGSSHGAARGGLTPLGREVLARMERLGMMVDLAHASPRAIDDVLARATRPLLVSHTGFQAIVPGPRNLSDAHLREVAARAGLVGVGFWPAAVGDPSPAGIARSIRHAAAVAGDAHVALGSDWDGAVPVAVDPPRLPHLTQALLDAGAPEREVRAVMGESALAFLLANLP